MDKARAKKKKKGERGHFSFDVSRQDNGDIHGGEQASMNGY